MTKEEVIDRLKEARVRHKEFLSVEALDMAIKALKQKPCGDAISRDDAIRIAEQGQVQGFEWEIRKLVTLPPVNPQPKTGHWIIKDGKEQGYDISGVKTWYIQIMCSEFGFIKTAIEGHTGQYHYCPTCGAEMQVESEDKE